MAAVAAEVVQNLHSSRHGALMELLEMVLLPPIWCKIIRLVGVARVNKIKNFWRWMRKLVTKPAKGILEGPHIMNRSRPPGKNESESHVEITYNHNILTTVAMSV